MANLYNQIRLVTTSGRVLYNSNGWVHREELRSLSRMGIRYYDQAQGTLVGRGEQ